MSKTARCTSGFPFRLSLTCAVVGSALVAAYPSAYAKDSRVPMWIAGASYWLVGAPTSLVLAFWFDLQGLGIWIGLAVALAAAAALMSWRFWYLTRKMPQDCRSFGV